MLVAWDFDGVLNRSFEGGYFLWQQTFEADMGISAERFTEYMFAAGRFDDILTGRRDLLDVLGAFCRTVDAKTPARDVLAYWLAKDALLDAQVMDWLTACPHPGVIATNNEAHRAEFIWNTLGLSAHLKAIFASGPLGVKKPDAGFFAAIEDWSGLPADQILLIDDAAKNIAAAAARGWQVFHFTEHSRADLPRVLGIG